MKVAKCLKTTEVATDIINTMKDFKNKKIKSGL